MSTAVAEPDLDVEEQQEEDEHEHIVCCCSRDIAMCGAWVGNEPFNPDSYDPDDDTLCPKCADRVDPPCVLCGYSINDRECACGKCWVWDLPDWQQDILRRTQPNLFI